MRNLQMIAKECEQDLRSIGIPIQEVSQYLINTRAKRRWGCCKLRNREFIIEINHILLDERNPIEALKNTLYHELLHTCKNCLDHKELWKRYAQKVKMSLGYEITRCTSAEAKGITYGYEPKSYQRNHRFVCEECGATWYRQVDRGFVTKFRCRCGGKIIKEY